MFLGDGEVQGQAVEQFTKQNYMDSCEGANNLTLPNSLHLDGKTGLGNTMAWVSYFHALAQNQRVSQVEWSQEIISFKLINFLIYIYFYWSTVALQCCVHFCWTT